MLHAIELSRQGVKENKGGPFGAVVVKDGKVVGVGNNQVTSAREKASAVAQRFPDDVVLGPTIKLGPIGAGPGRKAATVSALGTFRPCKGDVIPGELGPRKSSSMVRCWMPSWSAT